MNIWLNSMVLNAAPTASGIVNQLFPNLWIFIAHTLATISLLVILSKLVYQPFKRAMRERRNKIKSILIDANKKHDLAQKEQIENEKILQENKDNISSLVKKSQDEASLDKIKIINIANEKANKLMHEAKKNIISDNEKNKDKIKDIIGTTAIDIASRIIEKELLLKDHKGIINNFIKNIDLVEDDYDE